MRKLIAILMIAALTWPTLAPVEGQTLFKNIILEKYELRDKHNIRTISCFICHERVERGTDDPKKYRNQLGETFAEMLKDKDVTTRLEEATELAREARRLDESDPKRAELEAKAEAIEAKVSEEFKEALAKIEPTEAPIGGTYKEAFENGKVKELDEWFKENGEKK